MASMRPKTVLLPISFTIVPLLCFILTFHLHDSNAFQIRNLITIPNHDVRFTRSHFPTVAPSPNSLASILSLPKTSAIIRISDAISIQAADTQLSLAASSPVIEPDSIPSYQSIGANDDDSKEEDKEEGIGAWIPLASAIGLTGLGPQQIKVMGIDLVVWHTPPDENENGKKEWVAQVDACTHRLAPLSQVSFYVP